MVSFHEVTADEADIRLDRWCRRHFPGLGQGAIHRLCRTGQVRVDGRRADAGTRLTPGQSVRIPPLPAAPPTDTPAPPIDPLVARDLQRLVLYQDRHLIVLNKPHGLPVQGGPGIIHHLDGMLDALRFDASDRPRLVHRLDRDTSGVLVLARTAGVAAKLAAAFRGRTVDKTYWAITGGRPVPPAGRIDRPLKRVGAGAGQRTVLADAADEDAARAVTFYRTLDHAGPRLAWLEIEPQTGRTHQIRVHCVALRAPIVGDAKYAEPDQNGAFSASVPGLAAGLHLHARRLRLPHPAGGALVVAAALSPHMAETFRTLGFVAPPALPAQVA